VIWTSHANENQKSLQQAFLSDSSKEKKVNGFSKRRVFRSKNGLGTTQAAKLLVNSGSDLGLQSRED